MLKYLKEDWPGLLIYLALGIVLVLADLTIANWQYWAIFALMVALGSWTRARKFDKYFLEHMEMCEKCPSFGFMPPSSAPSAPEGTSQHDPKLPLP